MRPEATASDRVVELESRGRELVIRWADGHPSTFHAIWLRDNCPCPECAHPGTGQRLLETAAIPADVSLAAARLREDGRIEAVWTTDGHVSLFAPDWLRRHCYSNREHREDRERARRPARRSWRVEGRAGLPEARHADVSTDEAALRDWLAAVDAYGFAILRGVPAVPGMVTRVAELFGYVRETNYGRLFDVRSVVNPNNLAYTGLALSGHTDNPYRDPTPTLQLLHCLSSSAEGGDSTVVDGFEVAEALRAREPRKFDLLCRVPLRFRFADKDTELEAEFPVIALDVRGKVAAIRLNNRAKAPLDVAPDLVEPYYDAYRTFARMIESPEFRLSFKLEPGDLFTVDNLRGPPRPHRVLGHGRASPPGLLRRPGRPTEPPRGPEPVAPRDDGG